MTIMHRRFARRIAHIVKQWKETYGLEGAAKRIEERLTLNKDNFQLVRKELERIK